jgi:hypothetical protein
MKFVATKIRVHKEKSRINRLRVSKINKIKSHRFIIKMGTEKGKNKKLNHRYISQVWNKK